MKFTIFDIIVSAIILFLLIAIITYKPKVENDIKEKIERFEENSFETIEIL